MTSALVTCSGDGSYLLPTSVQVTDVFCTMTVQGPSCTLLSQTPPRHTKHLGWVGLGFTNDHGFPSAFNLPFMETWKWIDHEQEDSLGIQQIYNTGYVYADTLFWYATPGSEFTVWIQWN